MVLVLVCERECELGLVWRLIQAYPDCPLKSLIAMHTKPLPFGLAWVGCSDLIQPLSLSYSVIPFSFLYHFLIDKKMSFGKLASREPFQPLLFLPLRKEKKDYILHQTWDKQ